MKKGEKIFLIRGKKGSHVGMILSFMIFITFIIFVFVVLKPTINIGGGKQIIMDDSQLKILENVSSNFSIASVSFGGISNPNRQCIYLQKIVAVLGILPPYKLIVKNQDGITQTGYLYKPIIVEGVPTSDAIAVNRGDRSNTFFRIYQSPKFNGLNSSPVSLTCDKVQYDETLQQYSIGNVYSGQYAFEYAIRDLAEKYISNYSATKENLKISPANEFSFYVVLTNGSRIEATQPTSAKNIYAQETPIQYIDYNANIQAGYIIVKIW